MSTFSISFTADDGSITIGNAVYGPPAELVNNDVKTHHPLVWAVAHEYMDNTTTAGTIVVTAT